MQYRLILRTLNKPSMLFQFGNKSIQRCNGFNLTCCILSGALLDEFEVVAVPMATQKDGRRSFNHRTLEGNTFLDLRCHFRALYVAPLSELRSGAEKLSTFHNPFPDWRGM